MSQIDYQEFLNLYKHSPYKDKFEQDSIVYLLKVLGVKDFNNSKSWINIFKDTDQYLLEFPLEFIIKKDFLHDWFSSRVVCEIIGPAVYSLKGHIKSPLYSTSQQAQDLNVVVESLGINYSGNFYSLIVLLEDFCEEHIPDFYYECFKLKIRNHHQHIHRIREDLILNIPEYYFLF